MAALRRAKFPALGTDVVVVVTDPAGLGPATDAVCGVVADVDRTCSRFRDDSDLARVNAGAGEPVQVDPLLLDAVDVALRAARLTDGIVDPTVGEALVLLGYDRDFAAVRDGVAPVARVAHVPGWRAVQVDRERSTVQVPAGCRLDLGATAKAFAADLAAVAAHRAAGCGVLVSLGGDLRTEGEPPAGGWPVLVTDWQGSAADAPGQTVLLAGGSLATSSATVRRWARGGETAHHLVDPRTSQPAELVWRTVSVTADTCVDANIASTAAVILGADAEAWLGRIGLPARLIAVDGTVRWLNDWAEEAA